MLDAAKLEGNDISIGIIDEAIKNCPEIQELPFLSIPDTKFKYLRLNKYPHGAFRNINEGVAASKWDGEQAECECFPYQSDIEVDSMLVSKDKSNLGDLLAINGSTLLQGDFINLAEQIYYGTDPKGFRGLTQLCKSGMKVSMGGTGNTKSSVWFVHRGPHGVGLRGGKGSSLTLDEVRYTKKYEDDKSHWVYSCGMEAWLGLYVGHTLSIGCVNNVTPTTGLTQKKMAELLSKFPRAGKPDAIFMNPQTHQMWLEERAKVGQLVAGAATAQFTTAYENANVDNFMGIPVFTTDAIRNDE